MLPFLSKIIRFNRLLLLGVYKAEEGFIYYTLMVKKKGDNLTVISSAEYNDFEVLLKNIDIKLPVVVQIDGKGVLNKKISLGNEADVVWKKNIDFNTIYFTEYNVQDTSFISFSRKSNIDDITAKLRLAKLQIVDLYLGPLLSSLIAPALGSNEIVSNDSLLSFENGMLKDIRKRDVLVVKGYTISETTLSQYHLPLYGVAVGFFLKPEEVSKNGSDINTEEIIYQKSFNYLGISMLGVFLIALLTSYILIQYYLEENAKLTQENLYSNQTYKYITDLEKQREQKLEILNKTGQLSKNFLSFYAYELSKSLPTDISLSNLEVFPAEKETKPTEKVSLIPNLITVKGVTISGSSLDHWLGELKKMKWIKKFEIVSIKKDKKNIQQFELKILLNNV